jgi:hypothetical protein
MHARNTVLLLTLVGAVPLLGCSDRDPGDPNKNAELIFKVKLDAARRALKEIEQRKDTGKPIYADCKTAKMLFLADLKQHESKEARQLAVDLLKACQKANASELVEVAQ